MLLLLALAAVLPTKRPDSFAVLFTTRAVSEDACNDIHNCRLLFDVVWGCLVTIFACIWVSVHPNVPPPKPTPPPTDGPIWQRVKWRLIDSRGPLRSRFKLMLVAVLAPELIAGFAGRQLAIAWHMSKKYEISLTHGFFIGMGGFVDGAGHPIVTFAQIEQPGVLPAIRKTSESAIEDKSKGDAFSKGVAFFQGLWFVVQCIARTAQRLPLTELEAATLAFAVVNIFTWLLWWGKPLDVRDPLVIEVYPEDNTGPLQEPRSWLSKMSSLIGVAYDVEEYDPLANDAVPTFWFTSTNDLAAMHDRTWSLAIFGELLVATIFGAIHCVAWHIIFPSVAERWLWRASALLIAGIPLSLLAILWLDGLCDFVPVGSFDALFSFAILGYIPARLILLVLPFTALRDLPSATFVDVDWSVYIPHL
ncbi:hypothetical protein C8F01DRAFT_1059250 [Mycena amicta]|nr:hypothetical protein C8F01DRAFT_1059250 [Mycena amicta]